MDNKTQGIIMREIGRIYTPFKEHKNVPIQGMMDGSNQGTIVIHEEFVEGLQDLNEFSHCHLIFHFNRVQETALLVKPYLDDQKRGVFATRSPRRPNGIGMSIVKIVKIEGNTLTIQGMDILNDTPLLDIKPFIPKVDFEWAKKEEFRIGWLTEKQQKFSNFKTKSEQIP